MNFFVYNVVMSDENSEFMYYFIGNVIEVIDFLRVEREEYRFLSITDDRYVRVDEEVCRLMER